MKSLVYRLYHEFTNINQYKDESYNSIQAIVDYLTKIVDYKPVKVTINTPDLTKVIINIVIRHYKVFKSSVINENLLFVSKFWFLLYYFLDIKKAIYSFSLINKCSSQETK